MTVQVPVLEHTPQAYTIHVGAGLLASVGELCRGAGLGQRGLIITNEDIASLYLDRVVDSLRSAGYSISAAVVPPGEGEKNWQRAGDLLSRCVEERLDRRSFIVALGGGVIGDLAGFVAAVYMRGIAFVQVPTSLLAQVDASVGGKVAVNHPAGKNLLGAFHQPRLVVADTDVLNTLPDRELAAGMAEVVKHGLIRDPDLYAYVRRNPERFRRRDPEALQRAVVDSCRIKAGVVGRDEREQGERAVLNFGHTVGHALEAAAGYGTYTHGEAVAIGMVAELMLSARIGDVRQEDVTALVQLLHALGLPSRPARGLGEKAMTYLMRDKKVQDGQLRLALLRRIGWAEVTDAVGPEDVRCVLQRLEEGDFSLIGKECVG